MTLGVFGDEESNGISRFSKFRNFRVETENRNFRGAITPSEGSGGR